MFISNLWVVLMIRVVNLMIGLPSTVNLYRRRWTSYESDAPRPVYILEKNQNVNRMEDHPIHICKWKCESDGPSSDLQFFFQNVNRMGCYPVYNFFQNVNRMRGIRFSIFFFRKKQKVLLVIFRGKILTFLKLMEV